MQFKATNSLVSSTDVAVSCLQTELCILERFVQILVVLLEDLILGESGGRFLEVFELKGEQKRGDEDSGVYKVLDDPDRPPTEIPSPITYLFHV